jgi:hypothetical protein
MLWLGIKGKRYHNRLTRKKLGVLNGFERECF